MIRAIDLRISDYLRFDNIQSQITAIDLDLDGISNELVADGKYNFIEVSSGRITGVKINEDVLVSAGFEKVCEISETMNKWQITNSNFILYYDVPSKSGR